MPGDFVDTTVATGVVYSVPAHAPYDYVALLDLQKNKAAIKEFKLNPEEIKKIEPIQIIDLLDFEDFPAKVYCEKYDVHTQTDFEKLDKATVDSSADIFSKISSATTLSVIVNEFSYCSLANKITSSVSKALSSFKQRFLIAL